MKPTTETPIAQLTHSEIEQFKARYTAEPAFKQLFDTARSLPPDEVLRLAELLGSIVQER